LLLEERRRLWTARERELALWLHRASGSRPIAWLLVAVSWFGDGVWWYALIATLPWWGGASGTKNALYMIALGAVNLVFYKALKQRIARPRPYVLCPEIRACCPSLDEYSFPSGHTMHAVAFSLVLSHYHPALALPLWIFTVLVSLSRVVLGLHYPSDVAAGAAIGWLTAKFMLVIV